MVRSGKQQVLVRHFRPMATFSFVAMATSVWEFGIFSMNQGLIDGGRAGLIWSTVVHAVGFVPIVLSMAEMSSIAPTAGSQYHWVSEFCHPRYQKVLSYYTGWISTMAWQAGNAVGVFLTGTLIQTIILENNNDYAFPSWHGSLLVMSNIAFTVAANILLTRYIPRVQTAFFVLHILAFFAVLVPIIVNAPKASASEVFTEFTNTGGWSSTGFAVLAGQLSAIYMMCGTDSVSIKFSGSSAHLLTRLIGIEPSRGSS
jgi:choline transport protein